MNINGFDKLARHVPELTTPGGRFKIAAYSFSIFTLTSIYFILTDQIPTWTIDSQVVVMALGYLLLSRFFTQKKKYIEKYKEAAYRHAFGHFAIPGLAVIFAGLAHTAYMNGPKFTQPILVTVFTWAGWLFVAIGALLFIRAITTFGVDNLTMLYVYFPEESSMLNSSIYGVIRHPIYAGALRVGIGLALLNTGIYALTFAILLPLGLFSWIRLVEEKELLERIPNYAEYRKGVPAFLPYPNKIFGFFKFILTGK